jgi:hypothetical protein
LKTVATTVATEAVDTVVEMGIEALTGLPIPLATSPTDLLQDMMRKGLRETAEAGIRRGGKELVENGMERASREGLEEGAERAGRQGVEQPRCKQKNDLDEPSCFLAGTQIVVPGDAQNSVMLMVDQNPSKEQPGSVDCPASTERMLTSALLVGLGWTFSRRQRGRGRHAAVLAGHDANAAAHHRTQNRHSAQRAVLGGREMRRLGPGQEESETCLPPVRGTDAVTEAETAGEGPCPGRAALPRMAGGGALPADTAGIVCPMRAVLPRDAERGAARHERVGPGSRLLAALCLVAALAVWLPLPAWLAGQRGEERHSPALTAVDAAADCAPVHAQLPAGMAASQNAVGRRAAALHRGTALALTAHGAERGQRPGAAPGPDGHPAAWATRGIECLQPGETVLAWDPATGRVRPQPIEATFVRTTRRLRVLEIADGRGEVQTLHTTDEHPFWSMDRRQFVAAGELHPGEGLLGLEGSLLHLLGSRVDHHPRGITVYNFRVAHDHTYFAAASPASAPLLVHNADGCDAPSSPDPHRNAPPKEPASVRAGRWRPLERHTASVRLLRTHGSSAPAILAEARPFWQPAPTVSRRLAACWQTLGRHGYPGQLSRPCAWGRGTDRSQPHRPPEKGLEAHGPGRRRGTPLVILTCGSHVSDHCQILPSVLAFPKIRGKPGAPKTRPRKLYADRGYDSAAARVISRWLGIKAVIARRNREHGSGLGKVRWVMERTISWLKGMPRMRLRYDRLAMMQMAWNALAASVICFRLLE